MDWLKNILKDGKSLSLSGAAIISILNFGQNLIAASSDGVIDSTELHQLMGGADGIQMVIIIGVMIFLKLSAGDKK